MHTWCKQRTSQKKEQRIDIMRQQPKRTGVVAQRNQAALKKRAKIRAATLKADKSVIRVNLVNHNEHKRHTKASKENRKVVLTSLDAVKDEIEEQKLSRDSMLSSLTPSSSSSSSLGSDTLPSTSVVSMNYEKTKQDEPIITKLPTNDSDIFRILPTLKNDFSDASKDENQPISYPLLEDMTMIFAPKSTENVRQGRIRTYLETASECLWLGDVGNAELEYQVSVKGCCNGLNKKRVAQYHYLSCLRFFYRKH